jgi:hypothetical protein
MDRNEFFAVLDQLTPSQIEARLSLWDHEQLIWAGEYLDRRDSSAAQAEQGGALPVADAESAPALPVADAGESAAAAAMARRANTVATVAIIIAIGAMLAAIASGLVAFEALQN